MLLSFVFTFFFWKDCHDFCFLSDSTSFFRSLCLFLRVLIALRFRFFSASVSVSSGTKCSGTSKSLIFLAFFFGGCSATASVSKGPSSRFSASLVDADAIAVEDVSAGMLSSGRLHVAAKSVAGSVGASDNSALSDPSVEMDSFVIASSSWWE
jgi:hypothetical protein